MGGIFSFSFDSVQYPVNDDVSVNAFSSDSPMAYVVTAGGEKDIRYNNKNSSSYFITCEIYLDSKLFHPKCTKMYGILFQILKM